MAPTHPISPAAHGGRAGAAWLGLALGYFAYFGLLATLQPYLATLYFEHRLGAGVVGSAVALLYVLAGTTPLVAAAVAARLRVGAKRVFVCSAATAFVLASVLYLGTQQAAPALYVAVIAALTAAYAPINAMLDASALQACAAHGWSFGRLRLMGSLGYIAVATVMGRVLPTGQVSQAVHLSAAVLAGIVLACAALVPDARLGGEAPHPAAPDAGEAGHAGLRPSSLALVCLVVGMGLHYASFGPFQYGFTLYGQSIGLSPSAIGLGWSLGVVSEVCHFTLAGNLLKRFGWPPLLVLAFLTAPLRWTALALLPSAATFFVSQLLHGPSFALFYAASMAALGEVVPSVRAQRSQTIYCALCAGLASGPAMLLAGYAYAYMSLSSMFLCMLPANAVSMALLLVAVRRRHEFGRTPAGTHA